MTILARSIVRSEPNGKAQQSAQGVILVVLPCLWMWRRNLLCMLFLASCSSGDKAAVDARAEIVDASLSPDAPQTLADARPADAGRALADATPPLIDAAPPLIDAAPPLIDAAAPMIDAAPPMIDAAPPMIDAAPDPDAPGNTVMTFFVTSTGSGSNGGNLGGLSGADAKCQSLATAAGAGARTWHAYLSTGSTGPGPIVDARDRIGTGPWANQQGVTVAANVASLHSNGILGNVVLDESGEVIPGNEHDALTGTDTDGTLHANSTTCDNWTDGTTLTQGQVGHCDTQSGDGESWNSQHSGSCDEASLNGNAGTGRLYCFAID